MPAPTERALRFRTRLKRREPLLGTTFMKSVSRQAVEALDGGACGIVAPHAFAAKGARVFAIGSDLSWMRASAAVWAAAFRVAHPH